MFRTLIACVFLSFLSSCNTAPAMAQEAPSSTACAPREGVVKKLSEKFGETLKGQGMMKNGITELFSNDTTGTFTVLITTPDMVSCMINAGDMWEFVNSPKGDSL